MIQNLYKNYYADILSPMWRMRRLSDIKVQYSYFMVFLNRTSSSKISFNHFRNFKEFEIAIYNLDYKREKK